LAIFELFSKRQKKLRGETPDVYTYDEIPHALRVQIIYILKDLYPKENFSYISYLTRSSEINKLLCREYGLKTLSDEKIPVEGFFLQEQDINKVLDIIELHFSFINIDFRIYFQSKNKKIDEDEKEYQIKNQKFKKIKIRDYWKIFFNSKYIEERNQINLTRGTRPGIKMNLQDIDKSINELNNRFKEHGVGYQFIENEIIRIDSELIHIEAVKPALKLLNETNYKGAQEEFLSAYEQYRHGKNKEALNNCLNSFESTMKAIISKHGWEVQENANASKLIQVCFDNNLIPSFWQTQISSLKSMLESSVPTGRNKLSGHGQGVEVKKVPDHLVAYMLHMTASTLVFLTTAEKELDKNE